MYNGDTVIMFMPKRFTGVLWYVKLQQKGFDVLFLPSD